MSLNIQCILKPFSWKKTTKTKEKDKREITERACLQRGAEVAAAQAAAAILTALPAGRGESTQSRPISCKYSGLTW